MLLLFDRQDSPSLWWWANIEAPADWASLWPMTRRAPSQHCDAVTDSQGGRFSSGFYLSSSNHSAIPTRWTPAHSRPALRQPGTQCIHAPSCDGRPSSPVLSSQRPPGRLQMWPSSTCVDLHSKSSASPATPAFGIVEGGAPKLTDPDALRACGLQPKGPLCCDNSAGG